MGIDDKAYERRWWILGVLCLSLVVITLDNTILNVALPKIVGSVGAEGSQLQWIVAVRVHLLDYSVNDTTRELPAKAR